MRGLALAALLALGACHRPQADQPAPGADGEAQARTAAKTLADLKAADDASRGPAPYVAPAQTPHDAADTPSPIDTPEAAPAKSDNADGDTNQQASD